MAAPIRRLKLSTGSFDRENTFSVNVGARYAGWRCSLHSGMKTADDGLLWIMQHASVISSSYSPAEVAERERLNRERPLEHGDLVEVDGALWRVKVKGDYSDCAVLVDPVAF